MQFKEGDNVRLKSEHRMQSKDAFELGDTVVKIVRFEPGNVALCTWMKRGKAQVRSIPIEMLEPAM